MTTFEHAAGSQSLEGVAQAARGLAPALASAVLVGGLGLAGGGYFPTSWGWSGLALLWGTAVALAAGAGFRPDRKAALLAAALAGLCTWAAASALWSGSVGGTVLEIQRDLVYAGGMAALVLLARRAAVPQLLAGAFAGISVVACHALATRLFPERLGVFDPVAGYRLSGTVGYWNGLGILCTIALLLGLSLAVRGNGRAAQLLAAALLPLLAATLYFTFSRGALAALALGLVVALAADPRRLQLAAGACVLAAPAAGAVWLASRSPALARTDSVLADASRAGHRLALALIGLAAASAALAAAFAWLERHVEPGPHARRAGLLALAGVGVLAVAVPIAATGGPAAAFDRAKQSFEGTPAGGTDLRDRFFSLSSNGRADLWQAALNDAAAHPLLGSGAGSYERYWLAHRPVPLKVRDAHSLYLETYAELGPVGVVLLLCALALPLAALRRARSARLAAGALGAYAAFLGHAAVDWDWELTAVTVPALLCGACLVLLGADGTRTRALGLRPRVALAGAAVALGAFALVGLVGASALSGSQDAAAHGNFAKAAARARTAERYAPWSAAPLQALGEAQLAAGEVDAAAATLRRAVAREPGDFNLWLDLARALDGTARDAALARAARLNPLSPEVAQFRSDLALEQPIAAAAPEVP
jgi:hypothetical protein